MIRMDYMIAHDQALILLFVGIYVIPWFWPHGYARQIMCVLNDSLARSLNIRGLHLSVAWY